MGLHPFAALVLLVSVLAFAGCTEGPSGATTGTGGTTGSGGTGSNAGQIEIKGFAYNPANLTVKKGTTVTWTNKDSVAHTVTKDSGQTDGPSSTTLQSNQQYSYKFENVGTFKYHCVPHGGMKGTIEVKD